MAKHETDVTSLVFGLVFLGISGVWALEEYDVLHLPDASVVLPTLLVVAGLLGLLLSVGRARRNGRGRTPVEAAAAPEESPQEAEESPREAEPRP